jgi:hypothetical protein
MIQDFLFIDDEDEYNCTMISTRTASKFTRMAIKNRSHGLWAEWFVQKVTENLYNTMLEISNLFELLVLPVTYGSTNQRFSAQTS